MPQTVTAAVAVGANLGERRVTMLKALGLLDAWPRCRVDRVSSFIETDPVGPVPQGRYLNAAAVVSTELSARQLLDALLEIERRCGRDRAGQPRWGPRTIDLDLLLYGDAVVDEPGLTIPHPRMHERGFVLDPLAEIAPDAVVPGRAATVAALRDELRGQPADPSRAPSS